MYIKSSHSSFYNRSMEVDKIGDTMATLWTDHLKKQFHMFLKLFLGYFNFFFIFKFYLGPNFFHSHSYVSGLVLPPFLTFLFLLFRLKKNNESLIISYHTGAYGHGSCIISFLFIYSSSFLWKVVKRIIDASIRFSFILKSLSFLLI